MAYGIGRTLSKEILGTDETTSVDILPFACLYFADGGLIVEGWFLGLVIIQCTWSEPVSFASNRKYSAAVACRERFLAMPTSVSCPLIVDLIRLVSAGRALQYVIVRR